jgi:hypothetical protein
MRVLKALGITLLIFLTLAVGVIMMVVSKGLLLLFVLFAAIFYGTYKSLEPTKKRGTHGIF